MKHVYNLDKRFVEWHIKMELVKRIMIIGIALTILEAIIYIVGIELTNNMYPYSERGVGWGIYTWYAFYWFFLGLVIINNLLIATINNLKIVVPVTIILLTIHIYFISDPIEYRPYRVLLRIIIAAGSTVLSLIAMYLLNRIRNNATQQRLK